MILVPAVAKKVSFEEIFERLEKTGIFKVNEITPQLQKTESTLSDGVNTSGSIMKEVAYRDVSRICKMGKAKLLAVLVEDKIKGIVNAKLTEMRT